MRFIFESLEGRETPVDADGVRWPFDPDAWGQLDFEERGGAFRVMFGGRSKRGRPCPRLGIQPLAANSMLIEFLDVGPMASGSQVVMPVSRSESPVDSQRVSSGTTSGDPVGEVLLGRHSKERYPVSAIRIPMGGLGMLILSLVREDAGQPMIQLTLGLNSPQKVGKPFRGVALAFVIHAANLITANLTQASGSMRVE